MSKALEVLKHLVDKERRRRPRLALGHVEEVAEDGSATINLVDSADNNIPRVRPMGVSEPFAGDTGYTIQLSHGQARAYWQRAPWSVGGADPP